MSAIFIVSLSLMAAPVDTPAAKSGEGVVAGVSVETVVQAPVVQAPVEKTVAAWRKEVSAALIRQARAKSKAERAETIRDLTSLYDDVQAATYLTPVQRRNLCLPLRNRLFRVRLELRREIARNRRPGQLRGATSAPSSVFDSESVSPGESAESGGAPGGGAVEDEGQALVDLIQRTIVPDSWDVNGGPGTIIYYRPLHVLVIRAPQDVHGHVGQVLNDLRRAGQ